MHLLYDVKCMGKNLDLVQTDAISSILALN